MLGREIPKQRGIYSEILTTEDADNLNVSQQPLLTLTGSINVRPKQRQCLCSQPEAENAKSNR